MFDCHLFPPSRHCFFFADFVPHTLAAQWDQNIFEGAFCNLLPGQCSGKKVENAFSEWISKGVTVVELRYESCYNSKSLSVIFNYTG